MPVASVNNPAGRLLAIITSNIVDSPRARQRGAVEAFASLFNVPASDKALMLRKLASFYELLREIEESVRRLENINPDHLIAWIPSFRKPWEGLNFNQPINGLLAPADETVLAMLRIIDDQLSRQFPEPSVEESELQRILTLIESAAAEVRSANLTPALRTYLQRHLDLMRSAIDDYRLKGYTALRDGLERTIGAFRIEPELAAESERTPTGNKVMLVLGAYALLVQGTVATLQLPQEVKKYLPAPEAPAQVMPGPPAAD